jgi:hypothetical protein
MLCLVAAACRGGEHCQDPDPIDGISVSLICSDQNVLEAEVPDGSLTGASMSKEIAMSNFSIESCGVDASVAEVSGEATRLVSQAGGLGVDAVV